MLTRDVDSVRLRIFDVAGEEIFVARLDETSAGEHLVSCATIHTGQGSAAGRGGWRAPDGRRDGTDGRSALPACTTCSCVGVKFRGSRVC